MMYYIAIGFCSCSSVFESEGQSVVFSRNPTLTRREKQRVSMWLDVPLRRRCLCLVYNVQSPSSCVCTMHLFQCVMLTQVSYCGSNDQDVLCINDRKVIIRRYVLKLCSSSVWRDAVGCVLVVRVIIYYFFPAKICTKHHPFHQKEYMLTSPKGGLQMYHKNLHDVYVTLMCFFSVFYKFVQHWFVSC